MSTLRAAAVTGRAPASGVRGPGPLPAAARRAGLSLTGVGLILVLWAAVATLFGGRLKIIPEPWTVIGQLFHDGFYLPNLEVTLGEAFRGFLIGNAAALIAGAACVLWPRARGAVMQVAAASYCIPAVAIGPLLVVFVSSDVTKVVISALSVFFVSASAVLLGLSQTSSSALDLGHTLGASRLFVLFRVRVRFAVPAAAAGVALSIPGALLGAIVAEYLGGDSGLGVAMVQAQQAFEVPRTWAIALLATLISTAGYGLVSLAARRLRFTAVNNEAAGAATAARSGRRGWSWTLVRVVTGVAAVVVVWYGLVWVLGLDPYLAKTPGDVLAYFFSGPHAAANRGTVLSALGSTLGDAAGGYVLGTALALAAAVVVLLSRTVDAMFTPIAMALRSIPLVALTPLVGLVFGRGFLGVTVLTATITFVPTFVNVVTGMRQVPRSSEDLMHAYDVGWRRTILIRSFYALPALASSARVAIPGAILGAVLAEYLATATGLGHLIALSSINSDFAALWATVTVTTVLSIVLYAVLTALESVALRRLSA